MSDMIEKIESKQCLDRAMDLESLKPPPDLLQALLILEPVAASTTNVIDPQLRVLDGGVDDWEIYTTRQQVEQASIENTYTGNDGENSDIESDSDSCISGDSITRKVNLVALNRDFVAYMAIGICC
ncbi:hypothetical protein HOY80DRAFT_1004176 [Tuber brumale]|nr:hypothetical protein HOY80DRAFT_1004176 [Tuber brumale]